MIEHVPTWTTRTRYDWHPCPRCGHYNLRWQGSVAVCACRHVVTNAVSRDTYERTRRGYPLSVARRSFSQEVPHG